MADKWSDANKRSLEQQLSPHSLPSPLHRVVLRSRSHSGMANIVVGDIEGLLRTGRSPMARVLELRRGDELELEASGQVRLSTTSGSGLAARVELRPGDEVELEASDHASIDAVLDARKCFQLFFPRSHSLEGFSGGHPDGSLIEFHGRFAADFDSMEQLARIPVRGATIAMKYMPLYHSHVLWNLAPMIRLVGPDTFEFFVSHVGPHFWFPPAAGTFPGLDGRWPLDVRAGLLTLTINLGGGLCKEVSTQLVPSRGDKITFERKFTLAELKQHGGWKCNVDLRLCVDRSYFDLGTIIDLNALPPTVSDETAHMVATILRGEKPPGYDWAITVAEIDRTRGGGDSAQKTYFVHKAALAGASRRFELLFRSGSSFTGDCIQVVEGEDRFILPQLTTEDMITMLHLVYGLPVPIPQRGVPKLLHALRSVLKDDYLITVLVPQWEREICRAALAIDKASMLSNPGLSFSTIYRLLSIIWRFPRGAMSVAKRVAVGVMADIVHLNADDDIDTFIADRLIEVRADSDSDADTYYWDIIIKSMIKHLYMVSSVTKNGLAPPETQPEPEPEKAKEPEPEIVIPEPEDAKPEPETVESKPEIAESDEEEEWHDEAVDNFNPRDIKCKCAIS